MRFGISNFSRGLVAQQAVKEIELPPVGGDVTIITAGGALSYGTEFSMDGLTMTTQTESARLSNGAYSAIHDPAHDTFIVSGPGFIHVYPAATPNSVPFVASHPPSFADGFSKCFIPGINRVCMGNYGNNGLHYSDDGGYTWATAGGSKLSSNSYGMGRNPNNGHLIATTWGPNMQKSTDNGSTWFDIPATGGYNMEITYAFGAWWIANLYGNLYRSTDEVTWAEVTAVPRIGFDKLIYVAENNTLLAGSGGDAFWWTTDGINWNSAANVLQGNGTRSLAYSTVLNRYYSGTNGVIFYSDNLVSWSPMVGSTGFDHYALAVRNPL